MPPSLLQRFADGFGNEEATELRVRIFRLICGLTGGLCLTVVAPLNAMQDLPWGVDVANLMLGIVGVFCYWQSCRGRHYFGLFLGLLVGLLDVVWFLNAGSDGSVTHFYYPVMVFVITLFSGWTRWVLAVGVWLNVAVLLVLEDRFPEWVIPFKSATDRLVDLQTGILCSCLAVGAVTWFVLANYQREQRRVADIASRLAASEAN
ncbi:MAG TPA: hypothetical protein VHN79_00105, partial [Lacunisphaera sp.]|nr:hypothetical protein [Lacunisphaera sp.]